MDSSFPTREFILNCCEFCGLDINPKDTHHIHRFEYAEDVAVSCKFFLCPITKEPLFDPTPLKCGHVVSQVPLDLWLRDHSTCPVCRSEVKRPDLLSAYSDFNVRSLLGSLQVWCPRCRLKLGRGELSDHLKIHCSFAPVSCPNKGCSACCSRRDCGTHQSVCPFALVPCSEPECPRRFPRNEIEEHARHCEFALVACSLGCGLQVPRRELGKHEEDDCSERDQSCHFIFDNQDCDFIGPSSALIAHQKTCPLRLVECWQHCGTKICARDAAHHNCVAALNEKLCNARVEYLQGMESLRSQLRRSAACGVTPSAGSTISVPGTVPSSLFHPSVPGSSIHPKSTTSSPSYKPYTMNASLDGDRGTIHCITATELNRCRSLEVRTHSPHRSFHFLMRSPLGVYHYLYTRS